MPALGDGLDPLMRGLLVERFGTAGVLRGTGMSSSIERLRQLADSDPELFDQTLERLEAAREQNRVEQVLTELEDEA